MFRALVLLISIPLLVYNSILALDSQNNSEAITALPAAQKKILLLPLDSRPPCKQLVADNARTSGIEIISPPNDILDYYTQPGNIQELCDWTSKNLPQCDAAIISIDQLLYGGLIASRENIGTQQDFRRIISFLKELHNANPTKKLYIFSIQPRMTPPASLEDHDDNKNLMIYSRLIDKTFQEQNIFFNEQLINVTTDISPNALTAYNEKFMFANKLNEELALLAQQGVVSYFTIGQDDSEPHSIANLKLREFKQFLSDNHINDDKVFITHGADEVALSLLGKYILSQNNYTPKIYIDYTDKFSREKIMPYMAISQEESVLEKLAVSGAVETKNLNEADFILFIHCGDAETDKKSINDAVNRLKEYIANGQKVALVDLSKHFCSDETLFPKLLKANIPINSLIAYSGWNTSSNSIGTAIAQSEIYLNSLNNNYAQIPVIHSNLLNLNNRFLEDFYYLKSSIDDVNNRLAALGCNRYTVLDYSSTYPFALRILQQDINNSIKKLTYSRAYSQPFTVGKYTFTINNLQADTSFPWPRTFEIYLESSFTFSPAEQTEP